MDEKRGTRRLKDENEITATIISGGKKPLKEKFFYNHSKDISVSGARIRANIFLPVDTLLHIDFTLKNMQQKINAIGKVKWTKDLFGGDSFEAGVEFFNTPSGEIKKLADYISFKQKFTSFYPV